MFLTAGARLDKYEVVAPLAVGGMAELYVARSRGLEGFEKLCVLKRILPQYARDDEFVQMFLDEARLAATLHHPNVVQVYDIGVVDGRYYFTMEYVHGQDLAAIIATARARGRGLKLEHSIPIIANAAAGLHHAHEQRDAAGAPLQIVHRDVSPTNILVSYDGNVKVADFGIAKAAARRTQTTVGAAKGKLSYMSPEQVSADKRLDRRSDVFSLSIVLYELTTGQPLFRGESDLAIAAAILERAITPPRALRATYPEALEQIVLKGLARDPDERFSTARELQQALEDFARAEQLRQSSVGLSELMTALFPDQTSAWQRASDQGRSLVDHITSVMATSRTTVPRAARSRTPTIVAGVAIAAAVVGWALALGRGGDAAAPAASSGGAASTAPADARPEPGEPAVLPLTGDAGVDAGVDAGAEAAATADARLAPADAGVTSEPASTGRRRRARPDAGVPAARSSDAGVPGRSGDALDDRLNPFKPPPEPAR